MRKVYTRFDKWEPLGPKYLLFSNLLAKGTALAMASHMVISIVQKMRENVVTSFAQPKLDKRWETFYTQLRADRPKCVLLDEHIPEIWVPESGVNWYRKQRAEIAYDQRRPVCFLIREWINRPRDPLTMDQVNEIDKDISPTIRETGVVGYTDAEVDWDHFFPNTKAGRSYTKKKAGL